MRRPNGTHQCFVAPILTPADGVEKWQKREKKRKKSILIVSTTLMVQNSTDFLGKRVKFLKMQISPQTLFGPLGA
jgi:hypothetical protein